MTRHVLYCVGGWLALVVAAGAQDMPLSQIIPNDGDWKLAKDGYGKIDLLLPRPGGQVWVYHDKGVDRATDASVRETDAKAETMHPPQLRTVSGLLYVIRGNPPKVELLGGKRPTVSTPGVSQPTCMTTDPDESTLFVGDAAGKAVWTFRIEKDGRLTAPAPYCALRLRPGETSITTTSLATDAKGRTYACTPIGIQVFDPTGRLCGILAKPGPGDMSSLAFGGADLDVLFVACGDKLYTRKMLAKGIPAAR
jgi:sugar lactone lactonase YvrE